QSKISMIKMVVDAGEVEKVKAEAIKAVEEKYAPIVAQRDALEASLHKELIGGGFARSKYIQDNIAVPVDMVQATYIYKMGIRPDSPLASAFGRQ
uniref:DUF6651 domain-containing protein n=1 Tax=Acinetobacter baumannii TaxID=470 RepID=UPI003916D9FE